MQGRESPLLQKFPPFFHHLLGRESALRHFLRIHHPQHQTAFLGNLHDYASLFAFGLHCVGGDLALGLVGNLEAQPFLPAEIPGRLHCLLWTDGIPCNLTPAQGTSLCLRPQFPQASIDRGKGL